MIYCVVPEEMADELFEKLTGCCVAGPCYGRSLINLPLRIDAGYILLGDEVDPEELAARYA